MPCKPVDNQQVADLITTHPDPLKTGATTGLINHRAPIREDMKPLGSLLLTPYLYDMRFRERPDQPPYGKPRVLEIEGAELPPASPSAPPGLFPAASS